MSNYLGNSFLQTEQPPKSELPSHSSLDVCHVATEAEPILSHLFGAEFGLEILLETGRLSSQLFSDWSVLCCSRTKLGSKNCHTIFGAEFGAAAPLLSQRAHTAHAFESQKPPL